jgi:hypothetical protein
VGDKTRGIFDKFVVGRVDGSSEPGGKHADCDYFVLDVTHDPFAIPALRAYANACESEYPLLASDLRVKCVGKGGRLTSEQHIAEVTAEFSANEDAISRIYAGGVEKRELREMLVGEFRRGFLAGQHVEMKDRRLPDVLAVFLSGCILLTGALIGAYISASFLGYFTPN